MNETPAAWRVEAPSLTLYAFHLRNDITKGTQQVMNNADQLWEQCVAFGEHHNIVILKSLKQELRSYNYNSVERQYHYTPANEDKEATLAEKPYLDDWLELLRKDPKAHKARHLRFHVETRHLPSLQNVLLLGEIYPLRIHDTYAVDLTLRYRQQIDIPHLRLLNPSEVIKASLGQTLLLFAKPVNVPESAYQDFANQCVTALLGEDVARQNFPSQIQPTAKGQLFGSPIFEYDNHRGNPAKRRHILVWLDSHPETLQRIGQSEAYHALLNLLCCRSKILYAYHQSRLCDRAAREIYSELEGQINTLATPSQETLEQLKQWLKQTPLRLLNYSQLLRDIEDHHSAIAINTQNYRFILDKIKSICIEKDDLRFLEFFLNSTSKRCQTQIQVDLRYLTPAEGLFQQTIDTIRGIVAIEAEEQAQMYEHKQKERDRKLQDTIQCLGVGIGAASIVASSTEYLTQKEQIPMPFSSYSLNPFALSLILSVVAFGVFYAGTWWISGLINPRRNHTAKLKGSSNKQYLNPVNTAIIGQVNGAQSKVDFLTFSQENSIPKKVGSSRNRH
ncbi:MAG TPA: hypothetical protein V6D14_34085 [Coleofasciculaceae cyanobacterium]|jgi:hypothetical protein